MHGHAGEQSVGPELHQTVRERWVGLGPITRVEVAGSGGDPAGAPPPPLSPRRRLQLNILDGIIQPATSHH